MFIITLIILNHLYNFKFKLIWFLNEYIFILYVKFQIYELFQYLFLFFYFAAELEYSPYPPRPHPHRFLFYFNFIYFLFFYFAAELESSPHPPLMLTQAQNSQNYALS